MSKMLVIIGMQKDLGTNIDIGILNELIESFRDNKHRVVSSMELHPIDHCSFHTRWGKKPGEYHVHGNRTVFLEKRHCIINTDGASDINGIRNDLIQFKCRLGMNKDVCHNSLYKDGIGIEADLPRLLKSINLLNPDIYLCGGTLILPYTYFDSKSYNHNCKIISDVIDTSAFGKMVSEIQPAFINSEDVIKSLGS